MTDLLQNSLDLKGLSALIYGLFLRSITVCAPTNRLQLTMPLATQKALLALLNSSLLDITFLNKHSV
jgi:hypothetical protein